MQIEYLEISDVLLIKPQVYHDNRGCFFESFNEKRFKEVTKLDIRFVQDNISYSKKNVLRGLHFQNSPFEQAKLVQVLKGRAVDVVVDLRKDSKTLGKHLKIELSEENHYQLFVPRGFAHGFVALTDDVIFSYKCDNYYSPLHEDGILFNDKGLGIELEQLIISEKDLLLRNFKSF